MSIVVKVSGTKATAEIPYKLDSVRYPVHGTGKQKKHFHANVWKLLKKKVKNK